MIVPIHEASEAPFFMSKLRARIKQNSAEKCNDKKKLTKVTDLSSLGFTRGKTSIQGKRETENRSFKGGGRKKDKRQLTPMMLIRMVMNHVPLGCTS